MEVTFLGTGTSQGVPLIGCECRVCTSADQRDKRLRTSVMIREKEKTFVIDTGPDFRQQMLRENVKKLDAVLFTHEHKDHIAGFDDVRAFNYIMKQRIDVYAGAYVQKAIHREFPYIFSEEKYPGIPEINLHLIENKRFSIQGIDFIPVEALHYKLPVFGFRINDFTYITDANFIPPAEKEKIRGSKIIVVNALRREPHISHFTFQQAIELMQELAPEQAYLTHISHQLGRHNDVEKELPSFISLAWDGLKIVL